MTISVDASRVGKRGTVVIPARLRRQFGILEGSFVLAEESKEGILIRPAAIVPVEIYSPEQKAAFLLSNTVDTKDEAAARKEVEKMGLEPDKIKHQKFRKA